MKTKKQKSGHRANVGKLANFGPWADLSGDLLQKITDGMSLEEQVHLSLVCKNWHSEIKRITGYPCQKEPWNFHYSWENSDGNRKGSLITALYDPCLGKTYEVIWSEWGSKTKIAFGSTVCAQQHGWFLFAKKFRCKSFFFLFHAFSGRHIWLPILTHYYDVATFSKDPLSPGCVILVSYHSAGGKVYIATCRIGDDKWKTTLVDAEYPVSSVVFREEENEFYCGFPGGILARFAISESDQTCNVVSQRGHGFTEETAYEHLVHYDGQLLLLVKFEALIYILEFDFSVKQWSILTKIETQDVRVFDTHFSKNLGNGAFFFMYKDRPQVSYGWRDRNGIWIDPPSVPNYTCEFSHQLRFVYESVLLCDPDYLTYLIGLSGYGRFLLRT